MMIITPQPIVENQFSCSVYSFKIGAEDCLYCSFNTQQIKFKMVPCIQGQILIENRCYTCSIGYSFQKNITLETKCYDCPKYTKCKNGN